MTDKQRIDVDIEFTNQLNSDCGGSGFEWRCPDCGEMLRWSPTMWWDLKCSCQKWDFDLIVKAEKINHAR